MDDRQLYRDTFSQIRCPAGLGEGLPRRAAGGRRRWTRTALLAAVLCAVLCCCAAAAGVVHWLGLRELVIRGDAVVGPSSAPQGPMELIGLAGYLDSPEGRGTAEWQAFLDSYDPDGTILAQVSNDPTGLEEEYGLYLVYTREMADALEEIAARHGLKLHREAAMVLPNQWGQVTGEFVTGPGHACYTGYLYEDGTFHYDGDWTAPGGQVLGYQLSNMRKGALNEAVLNIGHVDSYDQWQYESACGVPVTLALSRSKGLVIAAMDDTFVVVNLLGGSGGENGGLTRSDLEALVDGLDLNVIGALKDPELPDEPLAPPPPSGTREIYASALRNLVGNYRLPTGELAEVWGVMEENRFAVLDVDGDGREELVLDYVTTYNAGMARYVFDDREGWTEDDRLTVQLAEYPLVTFYDNGVVRADWSHNQGLSGDALWPHNLYRYDEEQDLYVLTARVEAWDVRAAETNGAGEPFPAEVDRSGTGVVYLVWDDSLAEDDLRVLDRADYERWRDDQLEGARELSLPWQPLTEENIARLAQ